MSIAIIFWPRFDQDEKQTDKNDDGTIEWSAAKTMNVGDNTRTVAYT
jgi:hypothetical protein